MRADLPSMRWPLITTWVMCGLIAGCATPEKGNRLNDAIGAVWRPEVEAILKDQGSHAFSVPREQAFETMLQTFQALGMTTDERDDGTGLIRASAVGPTPLSPAEWSAATAGEIPRLDEMITNEFGPLAVPYKSVIGAKFISLTPGVNRLVVSATVEGGQSGGRILLSVRTSQLVVGITGATHQPSYPPPEVASAAIGKIWAEFDNQTQIADAARRAPQAASGAAQPPTLTEQLQPNVVGKSQENKVLQAEADAALTKWRACLSANVTGLAVVSAEPAEVVVRAAYAACRLERESLAEIYNRQLNDQKSGNRIMTSVEHGVMDQFVLAVIQARAVERAPPQTKAPPAPSPSTKEEGSI